MHVCCNAGIWRLPFLSLLCSFDPRRHSEPDNNKSDILAYANMQNASSAPLQAELDFVTPPWPKISAAAKDCVSQLLTVKAEARPSASELLQVTDSIMHPVEETYACMIELTQVNASASCPHQALHHCL